MTTDELDLRGAINAVSDVVQNRPRPLREFDPSGLITGHACVSVEVILPFPLTIEGVNTGAGAICIVGGTNGNSAVVLVIGGGSGIGAGFTVQLGGGFASGDDVEDFLGPFFDVGATGSLGPGYSGSGFVGQGHCGQLVFGGTLEGTLGGEAAGRALFTTAEVFAPFGEPLRWGTPPSSCKKA